MIPLAQYFAESGGDDFTPISATPARTVAASSFQRLDRSAPPTTAAEASRALRAVAPRPAMPMPRMVTEPRAPLREIEAERAAWQAERRSHAAALEEAATAARRDGIEIGRHEAREELEAAAEARIDALRSALAGEHALALDSTRSRWTEEQADRLADLMILQVAILEETIKLSFNTVLRPLAIDARRRQTLEELVGAVKTITLDGAAYRIAASGPLDLLSALQAKLGDHAKLLSFEADEHQTDIRIDADNTVIETRLSSWQLALEEALS